jgi:uncharacterized protein with von Willebrand factor type A (vWA) domain
MIHMLLMTSTHPIDSPPSLTRLAQHLTQSSGFVTIANPDAKKFNREGACAVAGGASTFPASARFLNVILFNGM